MGVPSLEHPTGRPLGQHSANVVNEHAHVFAVSSVADSIPTQPSIPATLPGSRSQLQGLRPVPSGPCLPLPDFHRGCAQDTRPSRLPSATEGPNQGPDFHRGCAQDTRPSRLPSATEGPPEYCLVAAMGAVGRYGARHRMFIPLYLVLRIRFPPSTGRRRPSCFSPGWTSRRNRIFHGLRSTRPTVARLLPDGRRVTGPVGPGEDPAGFIAPGLSYGRSGPG